MSISTRVLIHHTLLSLIPAVAVAAGGALTALSFLTTLLEHEARERVEIAARALQAGEVPQVVAERERVVILDGRSGAVLAGKPAAPEAISSIRRRLAAAPAEEEVFTFSGAGTRWSVARLSLHEPPRSLVAAVDWAAPVAPLERLGRTVAGVAALLLVGGGVVTAMLFRPTAQMIEDLTEATGEMGAGDFEPWLPPPVEGDVGRLSMATSRMAQSLGDHLRRAEQGARVTVVGELATYLAHEIRNPLSSIRLNLQSLDREIRSGQVPRDFAEVVGLCLDEIERLDRVAVSVLELGRGPADLRLREVHAHDALRRAVAILSPELERRGVRLDLSLDATRDVVLADEGRLRGAFLAILMNASEAMSGDGVVQLSTEVQGDGERLAIRFLDSGPGVPPGIRDRLFDPFFTTKRQGSGIGLALARRTVEAQGGRLYLETASELVSGATFVVELPLVAAGRVVAAATCALPAEEGV